MEADEVDAFAFAVPGDFQQIEDTEETRSPCELRGDVGQADGFDGIDFDFAFLHAVARAYADVRASPDAHAHRDFTTSNAVAQALGKDHGKSVYRRPVAGWQK